MRNKKEDFICALHDSSLDQLKRIEKSDLHNHAIMGGNINYLSHRLNINLTSFYGVFKSVSEMDTWTKININTHCKGFRGYMKRIEAAFVNAVEDGVTRLSMSFCLDGICSFKDTLFFIDLIKHLREKYAPSIIFLPELSIRRDTNVNYAIEKVIEILSHNWFKSIDICGDEFAQSIKNFKNIYKIAKDKGLILKAHVGEFGSADDVFEAVEELELSQVHHGIAASSSEQVMRWLSDNNIQLNICPTSNIMLNIVSSYNNHPIKKLYDFGIPVTINTDDMLLFNQSASQEYLNLYKSNLMSASELNEIRLIGLERCKL